MSDKHGYGHWESPLAKAMRGAGTTGPATVLVVDEDPVTMERTERAVPCDRAEVRTRLLAAAQAGDPVIKSLDLPLFDRGIVRGGVWSKICPDLEAAEPLVKGAQESEIRKAATGLDELARKIRAGEEL